jgi:hypothetical protein
MWSNKSAKPRSTCQEITSTRLRDYAANAAMVVGGSACSGRLRMHEVASSSHVSLYFRCASLIDVASYRREVAAAHEAEHDWPPIAQCQTTVWEHPLLDHGSASLHGTVLTEAKGCVLTRLANGTLSCVCGRQALGCDAVVPSLQPRECIPNTPPIVSTWRTRLKLKLAVRLYVFARVICISQVGQRPYACFGVAPSRLIIMLSATQASPKSHYHRDIHLLGRQRTTCGIRETWPATGGSPTSLSESILA